MLAPLLAGARTHASSSAAVGIRRVMPLRVGVAQTVTILVNAVVALPALRDGGRRGAAENRESHPGNGLDEHLGISILCRPAPLRALRRT